MSESIEVSGVIPAAAERIFNAWLSADEHSKMVGNSATYAADGSFTAWDGYITGQTLEQTPHSRIVQSWRTNEFPEGAPDSRLEVLFTPEGDGTRVTLKHTGIPDGQGQSYQTGWGERYLEPMTRYFDTARSKLRGAGEAMTEAAEQVKEAGEAAGEAVSGAVMDAMTQLKKTAKKTTSAVRKLVKRARSTAQKAVKRITPKSKPKAKAKKAARPAKNAVRAAKKVARKIARPVKKAGRAVKKAGRSARPSARPKKRASKGAASRGKGRSKR